MYIKNKHLQPIDLEKFEADPSSFEEAAITCMCMFQDLSTEFIDRMGEHLNWKTVVEYQFEKLTPQLIRKYSDKISFRLLFSKLKKLDEDWVRSICDIKEFDWVAVLEYGRYSKKFIEDFSDKWNWSNVWHTQCFGVDFIEKHMNKVKNKFDWKCISVNGNLTSEFMIKYRKKLFWDLIVLNQKLDKEVIAKCSSFISFAKVLNNEEAAANIDKSEETLRMIFSVSRPNIKLENFFIWEGRFSVDFVREFKDRIEPQLFFSCIKVNKRSSKLIDEFKDHITKANRSVYTTVLKYPHDLTYVKRYYENFDWWMLCNVKDYDIDKLYISCPEERAFLEDKKKKLEKMHKVGRWLTHRGFGYLV